MDTDVSPLVEAYRNEIIDLARALIRIPSENRAPHGDEREAQAFLASWFEANGITVDKYEIQEVSGLEEHSAYWPGRRYEGRSNVVARVAGSGGGKSLIFSSHVDTVTRYPLPWQIAEPFSAQIIDDRLYGRGAYDMKGALAATAMLLKIIRENDIRLSGNVYVESVVDEENAGANGTLASRLRGYNPDFAIIPEPTNLDICPYSKGGQLFEIHFEGCPGVNYGGDALVNPIYALAKTVNRIEEYERHINHDVDLPPLFETDPKPRSVVLAKVKAGDLTAGGNITIPETAWLEVFIQTLPGYEEDDLQRELTRFLGQAIEADPALREYKPVIKKASRYLYPSLTDRDHPMFGHLADSFRQVTEKEPRIVGASFACDSFIFDRYFNIPTALFGPRGGNAHGRDEWLSIESLFTFLKVALKTTIQYCK